MVLQRREQQHPHHGWIFLAAFEKIPADCQEHFALCPAALQPLRNRRASLLFADLAIEHLPIELFFGREMPENDRFIHAGGFGYLARRRALITLPSEQLHRTLEDLEATVFRGKTYVYCAGHSM